MTDTSVDTGTDWEKMHTGAGHTVDFPSVVAFLVVLLLRSELIFGLHLPTCPLDSCSVCQLVASGTLRRGEFAGKKREGFSRGSTNTSVSVVHPNCPSALQGEKKGFSTHYRVPFVQHVVEGMSVESGHCLPCTSLHAVSLYCSRTI